MIYFVVQSSFSQKTMQSIILLSFSSLIILSLQNPELKLVLHFHDDKQDKQTQSGLHTSPTHSGKEGDFQSISSKSIQVAFLWCSANHIPCSIYRQMVCSSSVTLILNFLPNTNNEYIRSQQIGRILISNILVFSKLVEYEYQIYWLLANWSNMNIEYIRNQKIKKSQHANLKIKDDLKNGYDKNNQI